MVVVENFLEKNHLKKRKRGGFRWDLKKVGLIDDMTTTFDRPVVCKCNFVVPSKETERVRVRVKMKADTSVR